MGSIQIIRKSRRRLIFVTPNSSQTSFQTHLLPFMDLSEIRLNSRKAKHIEDKKTNTYYRRSDPTKCPDNISDLAALFIETDQPIVLITGAATGIGLATADGLASAPYNYFILMAYHGPEEDEAFEAARRLQDKGLAVKTMKLDVADDKSIESACKMIQDRMGRLDILINNAGMLVKEKGHIEKPISRADFNDTLQTNLCGAAMVTEHCIPLLKQAKHTPRIIFMTSSVGSLGLKQEGKSITATMPMYRCSQAALNMLCLHYAGLYKDWKINACDPGFVKTDLVGSMNLETPLAPPHIGARHVVELATEKIEEARTSTFSDWRGTIPW
jgi:NAD(P)-dependent dehydrogenase (short-subunit alcohol dehydrogenase family)